MGPVNHSDDLYCDICSISRILAKHGMLYITQKKVKLYISSTIKYALTDRLGGKEAWRPIHFS